MTREHRETLKKFITNVQAYRETIDSAKAAAKKGDHSKARSLNTDAQMLGEAVDQQLTTCREILSAEQLTLL